MKQPDFYEEAEMLFDCLWAGNCNELFSQYWRLIFNTIRKTLIRYHISPTMQKIEDLRSIVCIRLLENNKRRLWQYDEKKGSLANWIILITTRIVLNEIRPNTGPTSVLIDDVQEAIDSYETGCGIVEKNSEDLKELMRDALQMLSSRDPLIIELFYYDELSADECAKVLNISVNAFYAAKHNAIKRLAKIVKELLKKFL